MTHTAIRVNRHGRILEIELDRPRHLNALSRTLLDELVAVLDEVRDDDGVSVVTLGASGDVFTVGYNVTKEGWIFDSYPGDMESVDAMADHEDIRTLVDFFASLWKYPKPIVAKVQGMCLSGGNELLAACDIVVASEAAEFGHPAGRDLGIPPTVFNWPFHLGMRKTRELLYTSKSISATEAHRLGMVNHVVSPDELAAFTLELCEDIARTPLAHLKILKRSTSVFFENMGMFESWETGAALDTLFHQSDSFLSFFHKVQQEGLGPALAERARQFEDGS